MASKPLFHLLWATALACFTLTAQALPVVFTASLSGSAEAPPNASPGTGLATITVDAALHTLRVEASFSGLIGTVTAAHIHCCTPTAGSGTAGVATATPTFPGFPAGVTAGSYDHLFDLTQASSFNASFITALGGIGAAEFALLQGIEDGTAYFNIHTTAFPGGEIRGFLQAAQQPVPEPQSLWLAGLALLILSRFHRRQPA